MLTLEQLKATVDYCPITGNMKRKDTGKAQRTLDGSRKSKYIMICRKVVQRNKIAWALGFNQELTKRRIYHLDGDPMNFSLSNLTINRPRKK
jgi:hypothetical protein